MDQICSCQKSRSSFRVSYFKISCRHDQQIFLIHMFFISTVLWLLIWQQSIFYLLSHWLCVMCGPSLASSGSLCRELNWQSYLTDVLGGSRQLLSVLPVFSGHLMCSSCADSLCCRKISYVVTLLLKMATIYQRIFFNNNKFYCDLLWSCWLFGIYP